MGRAVWTLSTCLPPFRQYFSESCAQESLNLFTFITYSYFSNRIKNNTTASAQLFVRIYFPYILPLTHLRADHCIKSEYGIYVVHTSRPVRLSTDDRHSQAVGPGEPPWTGHCLQFRA